jgi:hypothetical protein
VLETEVMDKLSDLNVLVAKLNVVADPSLLRAPIASVEPSLKVTTPERICREALSESKRQTTEGGTDLVVGIRPVVQNDLVCRDSGRPREGKPSPGALSVRRPLLDIRGQGVFAGGKANGRRTSLV